MDSVEYQITEYLGNVMDVTTKNAAGTSVKRKIFNATGYYADGKYYHYVKNYLGSVCAVVESATGDKVQGISYSASGIPSSSELDEQPYLYNGKEFIEAHGLNEYDSQARMYYPVIMRTTTMDPRAEDYYHLSPYSWCGNNPVNAIDPDGMDWYKDNDGNVLWQDSHDETITLNDIAYTNIGENFDHVQGNTTYTYHQNELASITTDVMSEENYVSQFSKEDWNGTPAMKACNKACDAMLASAGYKSAAPSDKFTIVENLNGIGSAGAANDNAEQVISQMKDNLLYASRPFKACVDIKPGCSSADKIGDHFIVIMGIKEYISQGETTGVSYRFFEPGTRQDKYRIGELYLVGGRLTGNAPYNSTRHYVVSSIRLCR